MHTHFVTYRPKLGRTDQLDQLKSEAAGTGTKQRWTISSKAKPGDCVLVYFADPIAQIVAVAEVMSKAQERTKSEYKRINKYRPRHRREFCADFHQIRILDHPVNLPDDLANLCLRNWWGSKPWNSPRRILNPTVEKALLRLVTPSPLKPTPIPFGDSTSLRVKAA